MRRVLSFLALTVVLVPLVASADALPPADAGRDSGVSTTPSDGGKLYDGGAGDDAAASDGGSGGGGGGSSSSCSVAAGTSRGGSRVGLGLLISAVLLARLRRRDARG